MHAILHSPTHRRKSTNSMAPASPLATNTRRPSPSSCECPRPSPPPIDPDDLEGWVVVLEATRKTATEPSSKPTARRASRGEKAT